MAAGTRRGSPSRRAVARLGQSPPEHPPWAPRLRSPRSEPGTVVLPADSAALFQAWSGLRLVEDCGSFFAEKPQITLATGPDKASVGGSLPDKPCCSHQPQGPGSPRLSPEVSASPGSQPFSSRGGGQAGSPLSSGLRAQEKNTLIL